MLTKFKMFAVVAVAAMALTGCAKEESSLSIDDLPGRAKVKGIVYYSNEQKYVKETENTDPVVKDLYVPKAEVKVLAKIDNASLDARANGYTIFETTTDAEGRYEFEIPVPENGIAIELEALPFEGMKNTYDGRFNNTPQFSEKEGVFKNGKARVTLSPNGIENKDIKYRFIQKSNTELEENSSISKTTLRVNVYEGVYSYSSPYFSMSNSSVDVTIKDENNNTETKRTSNGSVYFEIENPSQNAMNVTITVTSNTGLTSLQVPDYFNDFGKNVQGQYQQFHCEASDWSSDIATDWKNGFTTPQTVTVSNFGQTEKVYLLFKPYQTEYDFCNGIYDMNYYRAWIREYKNNY